MTTLFTANNEGDINFHYTLEALEYIRSKLQQKQCQALAIQVIKRGCSGFSYQFKYGNEPKIDEVVYSVEQGISIFVKRDNVRLLRGAKLEYKKSGFSGQLTFINPNEVARCGCGESFTVSEYLD